MRNCIQRTFVWGGIIRRFSAILFVLVAVASLNASVARAEVVLASREYVDAIVGTLKQPDWNQTDVNASNYIKNKPDVYTKNQVDDLLDSKANVNDIRFSTIPSAEPSGTPPEGQVYIWFN